MAQPKKVLEFLESVDIGSAYSLLVQGYIEQEMLRALISGRTVLETVRIQSMFMNRVRPLIFDHLTRLCGELFTDDDMDQLIAFNRSPVAKKLREADPEMQTALINFLSDRKRELGAILEDVISEAHKAR